MIRPRRHGDAGQAFPIYVTVVGGLLFLALAYFAVGQATVHRSGAQTAADAAALAAAQGRRAQLADEWSKDVLDPARWQENFAGEVQGSSSPCGRAQEFASRNDAQVLRCLPDGALAYTVDVETNRPVGESIVPGTRDRTSQAHARAVVEPLCTVEPLAEGARGAELPRLTCGDRDWDLDPEHLTDLPKPQDLFDVHLADRPADDERRRKRSDEHAVGLEGLQGDGRGDRRGRSGPGRGRLRRRRHQEP